MLGIIINPKSGRRAYRKQRLYLFKLLKERRQPFTYKVTKYAGHATELAQALVEKGYDELLVLGGDGTLSEVVQGVMQSRIDDKSKVAIGLMPRGTGNDWGRYWGLTRQYKRALDVFFNHGKRVRVDVGCLKVMRVGREEKHYFINSVGFGVDALTCKKQSVLKYYVGGRKFSYLLALLAALRSQKPVPVVLQTDEGLEIKDPLYTMNIGNGPYSGGGIKQNPDADPTDGVFHGMFVSKPTFSLILKALPKLFNGGLKDISFIHHFTARQVQVLTRQFITIEKDGLLIEATGPYHVEILKNALQIVVPE